MRPITNPLNIEINVDKGLEHKYPLKFKKNIQNLLTFVQREHLKKLGGITITEYSPNPAQKKALGLYYEAYGSNKSAFIVICVANVFNKLPRLIFFVAPLIPKIFFSDVLYHEIAHHVQKLEHGHKKETWEKHANEYSKQLQKKFFKSTLTGKILYSCRFAFFPLIKFMRRR